MAVSLWPTFAVPRLPPSLIDSRRAVVRRRLGPRTGNGLDTVGYTKATGVSKFVVPNPGFGTNEGNVSSYSFSI